MSEKKIERNYEITKLINLGINYRDIAKIINITVSRIEQINKCYNKDKQEYAHCVRCGETKNLILKGKVRNICKTCREELRKI